MNKIAVKDFLVEIHTEELPPKALHRLGKHFLEGILGQLSEKELSFGDSKFFATPRRLAVYVKNVAAKQADSTVERKGPSMQAAFDQAGHPTAACIGFARSCGVAPEKLTTIKTEAGSWVGFIQKKSGKKTIELIPDMVQQALTDLPIPKRMRWGHNSFEFVRPVHSVILLFDTNVVNAEIIGCKTGRRTRGHRFMSKGWLEIKKPSEYAAVLEKKGFVIADFDKRKELIREKAKLISKKLPQKNARLLMSESLLDEVTGLVEWPVAVCGSFDRKFLNIPQEVLISAMQDHQRYFPVIDNARKLLPYFVTISNIKSKKEKNVVTGNERVLRARLSDAAFFYQTDQKQSLEQRLPRLKNIIFQAKLGSLYDKAQRISYLSGYIANEMGIDVEEAKRAGLLAKTDLTTELVGEFPELQGTAGYYYALHDGESKSLSLAMNEQYMPRFSGSDLPSSPLGCALAIADRIDTLIGVFGMNQQPTGDKDPFGLRRAALGTLRILIEKKLNLDLKELLEYALANYSVKLENHNVVYDVFNFMLERLKPWYQEQEITPDVFSSVISLGITNPYDLHCRIQAVQAFKKLSAAESLSIANKRVSNIIAKYTDDIALNDVDESLFESNVERILSQKLKEHQQEVIKLSKEAKYQELLSHLSHLREPVDNFFDHVLVMTDDKARRENRLLMLKKLRELFLHVADIALLQ